LLAMGYSMGMGGSPPGRNRRMKNRIEPIIPEPSPDSHSMRLA